MGQLSTCCIDYSNILDDDSLLNTFYLYRPFLLGEDQDEDARLMGGSGNGSVKTGGTNLHMFVKGGESLYLDQRSTCVFPLSVQKAHPFWTCWHIRPPLPLVIDYFDEYHDITAEDKEGLIFGELGPSGSSQLTSSTNSRFPSHISCCL